ncbi:MAG: transcription elongation factor GreA, partial [Treponema sp.]|nr:transcription elongation factor GreA [Treponema sp.]
ISDLVGSVRNVHEAIATFEKHIAFDKGNYVYHRTWGVGRIAGISGDEISIDFSKKRGHAMSLKMAVEALLTLSKDHIWVLRATMKKEALVEKLKADKTWALRTIIKSFGNSCDFKRMKAELCPAVLSEREWTSWSSKAKEILRSDPGFGVSQDNIDVYVVREHPISLSEKLYNEFKAERNFYHRVGILRSFAGQNYSEDDFGYFAEMFSYFGSFLKTTNLSNEHAIASCLLVKELSGKYPAQIKEMADNNAGFQAFLNVSFDEVFKGITDIPGLYYSLKDGQLKKELIKQIRNTYGWADIYAQLFPRIVEPSIIEELEKDNEEKLSALVADCFERYRDRREAVVWLYKMHAEAKAKLGSAPADQPSDAELRSRARAENRVRWYEAAGVARERQIIVLIHLLDITFRDIENQKDTTEARKINRSVYGILFKDDVLGKFVDGAEIDTITRIYSFISDLKTLDQQDKIGLRSRIQDRHPDFKFLEVVEKRVSQGLTVTKTKYEEKQKQLARIMEVEVPANSREIEDARQLGDLKENAEYIAAKEKQAQLNTQVERLKEEIDRAQIFDALMIDTSRVSFGTAVTLKNENSGQNESYTILGPWESDPENHVISYQAPFGKAMINRAKGDRFVFTSDNENVSYYVERIDPAAI